MAEHPPVKDDKQYWLDKPSSLRMIIIALVVVCLISFVVPTILDIMAGAEVAGHAGDGGHGADAGHGGHGADAAGHGGEDHGADAGHGAKAESHRYFAYESWYGFHAIFGFLAYSFIVLTAKLLRKVLMRPEDYYE